MRCDVVKIYELMMTVVSFNACQNRELSKCDEFCATCTRKAPFSSAYFLCLRVLQVNVLHMNKSRFSEANCVSIELRLP